MSFRRSLSVLLGLGAALGAASSASANVVWDVEFQVTVEAGQFAGNNYYGTFTYTDAALTGEGYETLGSLEANWDMIPDGLLAFSFDFDGHEYTITDDGAYPDYPRVFFDNGEVVGVDFIATYQGPGGGEISLTSKAFNFTGGSGGGMMQLFSASPTSSGGGGADGYITFSDPVRRPPDVPSPAILWQGLGLAGLVVLRRRRSA